MPEDKNGKTSDTGEVFYDMIRGNKGKWEYVRSVFSIYKKTKKNNYDIIHVHYGISGLFLLNPLQKLSVPVILTLHGGDILSEQGKNIQQESPQEWHPGARGR